MPETPSKFPLADAAAHLAGVSGKTARRDANQARIKAFVDKHGPQPIRNGLHTCGHAAMYSRNYGGKDANDVKMWNFGRVLSMVSSNVLAFVLPDPFLQCSERCGSRDTYLPGVFSAHLLNTSPLRELLNIKRELAPTPRAVRNHDIDSSPVANNSTSGTFPSAGTWFATHAGRQSSVAASSSATHSAGPPPFAANAIRDLTRRRERVNITLDLTVDIKLLVWSRDHSPHSQVTVWPRAETYWLILGDHDLALQKAGLRRGSPVEIWHQKEWKEVSWTQPIYVGEKGRRVMLKHKDVMYPFDFDAAARSIGRADVAELPQSSPLIRKRARSPSPSVPNRRLRREDSIKFGTAEYPHVVDSDDE